MTEGHIVKVGMEGDMVIGTPYPMQQPTIWRDITEESACTYLPWGMGKKFKFSLKGNETISEGNLFTNPKASTRDH